MQNTKPLNVTVLPLLLLLTLCAGCAFDSPRIVQSPRLPLPQEARQPKPDPMCVPSCSEGLERLLDGLLPLPTNGGGLAQPASGSVK